MKILLRLSAIFALWIMAYTPTWAQTPQFINYQAIARNSATGEELINQDIFISLKILKDGPGGEIVYQENHDGITTNMLGLFNIHIGGGEAVSGSFNEINWKNAMHWLSLDIDVGNGLENMGAMQFVSVPYAFHAETVTQIDDADADPTNELVQGIQLNAISKIFSLVQEGGTLEVDMSPLIDDADNDPTNELVQGIEYDNDTKILTLLQEGESISVNLAEFIKDADSDPTNELVQNLIFNPETNVLTLIQEGESFDLDLGSLVNDADADPTNELVDDVIFDDNSKTFTLVQEGVNIVKNLSNFIKDADSDPTNELVQAIEIDMDSKDFTIVQEGNYVSTNLLEFIRDGDSDPTNELINILELANDTILKVQEGSGEPMELSLGYLKRDENWKKYDDGSITNIGDRVGINVDHPTSTFQVYGSIGYHITTLNNSSSVTHYVDDNDRVIICKTSNLYNNTIHIYMPDASTCPGRVVTIRKTGYTPVLSEIKIHFHPGPQLDFNTTHISLTSFSRETITFLSMGADGWTVL